MTIHSITRGPRFTRLRRGGVAGVVAMLAGLALAPGAGAATVVGPAARIAWPQLVDHPDAQPAGRDRGSQGGVVHDN